MSVSGIGQPLYLASPFTVGHLSLSSLIPSPSVSGTGQPWYLATPGTVGHLSTLSKIPSPSVSTGAGGGGGGATTTGSGLRSFKGAEKPML